MAARIPFRRRPLSLTSLIDVIFLLLLFFMLTTTFTRTAELPLVAGGPGPGTATTQAAPVFLRLTPDDLTLNGQPATPEAVTQRIADMGQDTPQVLVSLTPAVTAQRLADLLAHLRTVPGLRVQVLG